MTAASIWFEEVGIILKGARSYLQGVSAWEAVG
jgi:hypothetical protein